MAENTKTMNKALVEKAIEDVQDWLAGQVEDIPLPNILKATADGLLQWDDPDMSRNALISDSYDCVVEEMEAYFSNAGVDEIAFHPPEADCAVCAALRSKKLADDGLDALDNQERDHLLGLMIESGHLPVSI